MSPTYVFIRDNGKSKSWNGIHGLCENFDRQNRTATIQVTGEDTIDEVKARIEESYFDLLQTDLKVKSKDDIKVIYSSNMLEIHLTVLWNPTQ